MMDKREIAWLYSQLPELIAKGILSPESAERLKSYYGPLKEHRPAKKLLMVFGVIGSALVGLGIILILAHNWASLSRLTRLIISVGLLLVAQLGTGVALFVKRDSAAWREATSMLHMLMLGAAIALVGQTYHLTDDAAAFLLSWMLLSLPLVYFLQSNGTCLLYLIGITAWAFSSQGYLEKQLVWMLFLLVLPYCWRKISDKPTANMTHILAWALNICFYLCFSAALNQHLNTYPLLIYSCLFAINYILGIIYFPAERNQRRLPFATIGLAGGIGLCFVLTMNTFWRHLAVTDSLNITEALLTAGLLLLTAGGNILLLRSQYKIHLAISLAPLIVGVAYVLLSFDPGGSASALLVNAYLFALSIGVTILGVRTHGIGVVNQGMLLLAALIAARFFDSNFSFVVRGIVFVLLGVGFLAANLLMMRRKSEDNK